MPDADQDLPEPEEVGGDVTEDSTEVHRSSFKAAKSTGQAPKKSRGTFRLLVHHHYNISDDDLKSLGEAHGRRYVDGVDYGRALLAWIQAEGQYEENYLADAISYADRFTIEVAK